MTDTPQAQNTYAAARTRVLGLLPKNAVGAEIGVWKGDFSARILEVATPKTLHLIDPWTTSEAPEHATAWYGTQRGIDMNDVFQGVQTRFADPIAAGQIVLHRSASTEAMASLADGALDFVYVDGDHSFDAVRADLMLSVEKVRLGGLICVDDHMLGRWWKDGVVRAVNDVLGAHSARLMIRFAVNGQVVLQRR